LFPLPFSYPRGRGLNRGEYFPRALFPHGRDGLRQVVFVEDAGVFYALVAPKASCGGKDGGVHNPCLPTPQN
jgi:hypothetical protein